MIKSSVPVLRRIPKGIKDCYFTWTCKNKNMVKTFKFPYREVKKFQYVKLFVSINTSGEFFKVFLHAFKSEYGYKRKKYREVLPDYD